MEAGSAGRMAWAYRALRWVLGGVFIHAGSAKLLEPELFALLIEAYGLVPHGLLMPLAICLPALEVAAGIGILFDVRGSLTVIAGLLVLFMVILAYGIGMGLEVDCGCFGPEDPEAEAFHGLRISLYRDMAMLVGVAFIHTWRRYHSVEPVAIMNLLVKHSRKRRVKDA